MLHHSRVLKSRLRSLYWVGHCSMTNTYGLRVCYIDNVVSPASHDVKSLDHTYRGLMRWVTVNKVPRTMQMPPTATYAIPRKGFFPPITVRVDMTKDLVPPYVSTGKSRMPISVRNSRLRRTTYYSRYPPGTCCIAWSRYRCASPTY